MKKAVSYEPTVGLEVHVQLKTNTKIWCGCPNRYGISPNTDICPVCLGYPGALPVLNARAVELTVRTGLLLGCDINRYSKWDRKNYFYPDLPKGYQISQYELPFCENGYLEITGDDGKPYVVGIKRIHLEEDAGKLVHSSASFEESDFSLVDYNRSSVPLLEIVGDHERNPLRSINEAREYLEKLRQLLRYIDISDCRLEMGQFRCDVNISIRPKGVEAFGNRSEIKNMASFRFIMDALEYETKRQSDILEGGGRIDQETRLFDEEKRITLPMRSKEDAPDYRYFPDPDLLEIEIDQSFIGNIKESLPELPDRKLHRIIEEFGIAKYDAVILTRDKNVSDYFGECANFCQDRKRLSHWIINELFKLLNAASLPIRKCKVSPKDFSRLINMISTGDLTDGIGRDVLDEMFDTGRSPDSIVDDKGLIPISDDQLLGKILDDVVEENARVVEQIKAGEAKPIDFLIGQVMKTTKGKADPKKVRSLIKRLFTPTLHKI